MGSDLPRLEFETHGRIASAVAKTRENRALSDKNHQISAIQAQFHQSGRLKSDRLLDDESAQFELAFIYYIGDDEVSRNLPRAIHWLTKAARRGNHKAQYFLGLSHERGEGLAQDYTKAVHWYRIAAEQGSRQAQCNLADKYEHGLGVERDLPLAAHWYRKSAEQQIAPAQYSLGILYLEGRGVATDPDQGKYWLQQAAMQGYEDAIEALNRLD